MSRMHREQSRYALDHHLACIMFGFADQRDPFHRRAGEWRKPQRLRADPFRTGARLASAAAADHQPRQPRRTVRRELRGTLMVVSKYIPLATEKSELRLTHAL